MLRTTSRCMGQVGRRSICLGQPVAQRVVGIRKSDMRNLLAEDTEHHDRFIQEWERIHGRSE